MEGSSGPATCRCGHNRQAHLHYRPGSECAACDCARFAVEQRVPVPQWASVRWLGRVLRLDAWSR
jgi:hypothetical protein